MKRMVLLILSLLIICPQFSLGENQTPTEKTRKRPRLIKPNLQQDFIRRLKVARNLIQSGDFFGASSLLELLLIEKPEEDTIYNLLRQCYQRLKYYDKLEMLSRTTADNNPHVLRYRVDQAEALARLMKRDESLLAYQVAVKQATSESEHLAVISSMNNFGMAEAALELIDDLKPEIRRGPTFILQRGVILNQLKLYSKACLEYIKLLGDSTKAGYQAESRIVSLLKFKESSPEIAELLDRAIQDKPNPHLLKILSDHYLRSGQLELAYEYALRQDTLENFSGRAPLQFMNSAQDRSLHELIVRMAEHLLKTHHGQPMEMDARFVMARANFSLGNYVQAIDEYKASIPVAVNSRDITDAYYKIGKIYSDGLHQYDQALIYFDSAITAGRGAGLRNAMYAIPFCCFKMGDFNRSRKEFKRLQGKQGFDRGDWPEEIDYYLAMLKFETDPLDSTRNALNKLMLDYPKGFYVNDALEHLKVFDLIESDSSLIREYMTVQFFKLQQQPDSMIEHWINIANRSGCGIDDLALWSLASLNHENINTIATMSYIEQMEQQTPESYYLPYGLKLKADLLYDQIESREEARAIYRTLLEDYPNYPFITQVRATMRANEPESDIG